MRDHLAVVTVLADLQAHVPVLSCRCHTSTMILEPPLGSGEEVTARFARSGACSVRLPGWLR
jgi:hypothetical protein